MATRQGDPRKPNVQQARAEKSLRDLGATVSFSMATTHGHPEPVAGCFRCVMAESARRINEGGES